VKNAQKTSYFNKILIFKILLSFGVAIAMVSIFGKLAPIAIMSFRIISHKLGV